ncbi:KAP family NTPase [Pseudomonas sp. B2M1-30]|uniref:KAP family NTPase n=1 Tax=Pseudomonas TaxID=286 RepID=UPI0021C8C194|nr:MULTISPECIES: KAP family NTPase [Pseudomonas]MCU0120303.1 KAP family NTPase [Pseudomonas sp. B2M1-30]MCU7260867.1 KAP family NTPase [Pseudomonas koreensis]
MRFSEYSKELRASEITPLLQFFFAGILSGEAWTVGKIIGILLNKHLSTTDLSVYVLLISGLALFTCLLYAASRGACLELGKLYKSARVDLAAAFSLGVYLSYSSDGLGNELYAKHLEKLNFSQLTCIAISPLIIAWVTMTKASLRLIKNKESTPYFMSDRELEKIEDDLLDLKERAYIFSDRVLNGGSSESLVFGIDAPWGSGKSTFVNFCCDHWKKRPKSPPIIHRFEPLRYEEGVDLTEKFIDDLIGTIQQHVFAPSLRPLFKRYENLVKDKKHISLLDIKRTLSLNNDTIDSTLKELEKTLKNLNTRVIVIIDDLDRLHWSSIKSILFSIKRSFKLSNISYVLCYDTTNIIASAENPDSEKTLEFLEKFVNIKTSLFLNAQDLTNFVARYFGQSVNNVFNLSNEASAQLKRVTNEISTLITSRDSHLYTPFIGDIRKIKRVINTLMLLDIDKVDFNEHDFNPRDLLHLVFLYIYYPAIFRKIHDTETSGKYGNFSSTHENNLQHSTFYNEYKSSLNHPNQIFLLTKTFEMPDSSNASFTEPDRASRAFFQGQRRPLENYLDLIAKISRPMSEKSHRSHLNKKDEIFKTKNLKSYLDEISKNAPLNNEKGQEELWRIVSNHFSSLETEQAKKLITYFIEKLPNYSLLRNEHFNEFRTTAANLITKILDECITSPDKKTHPRLSTAELSIINLLYGDKNNSQPGIIDRIAKESRGLLGFHDLLNIRYHCTVQTKHENLWRSLYIHGNESQTLASKYDTQKNQARELSHTIFSIFRRQYIDNKINIFDEISSITIEELLGHDIKSLDDTSSWELKAEQKRCEIKLSITSQLGNRIIGDFGVYDESGNADEYGISRKFSNYLFSTCFNPTTPNGYIYFAEYLLLFTSNTTRDSDDNTYETSLSTILNNIEKDDLETYWMTHYKSIKRELSKSSERAVHKTHSTLSFHYDLPPIFRALERKFLPSEAGK